MSDIDFVDDDEMLSDTDSELELVTPKAKPMELSEKERRAFRESLNRDIEAFLQAGGQVQQIADNVRADPPRKPTINYGSAPI